MARLLAGETLSAIQVAQRARIKNQAREAAKAAWCQALPAGDDAAFQAARQAFADVWKRGIGRVQETVGSADGPVIKFVGYALTLIMPPREVPARATILDAVKLQKRDSGSDEEVYLSR